MEIINFQIFLEFFFFLLLLLPQFDPRILGSGRQICFSRVM